MVFSIVVSFFFGLFHKFCVQIIPFKLEKLKKCIEGEKDISKSVQEARHLRVQIMTLKATTRGIFWVDLAKNRVIVPQIIYQIVPYARDFLPIKFFTSVALKSLFPTTSNFTANRWKDSPD